MDFEILPGSRLDVGRPTPDSHFTAISQRADGSVLARGLDGNLYRLSQPKRAPLWLLIERKTP